MRKAIWILFGLSAMLCVVIVAFLLSTHLTGKSAWLEWKAARVAKGDRFEWSAIVPSKVPDEQNFAMAHLVAGAIRGPDPEPRFKALNWEGLTDTMGDWRLGRKDDLEAIAVALKSGRLEDALEPLAPALKELEKAAHRPASHLPVDYSQGETLGLTGFRGAARTLRVHALVALKQGDSETALRDVITTFRMARHFQNEPSLLATLLATAMSNIALQVVWEGTQDHAWNAAQLSELQFEIQKVDLLNSWKLAIEGERLGVISVFANTAEDLPVPKGLALEPHPPLNLGRLGKGWWYRNLLQMDRYFALCNLDVIDPKSHRAHPENWIPPMKWWKGFQHRLDLRMALIAFPVLGDPLVKGIRAQSALDQAAVACALERYRLANQTFPVTLDQLSPSIYGAIPHDLVDGRPMRYRRTGKGYLLYSVGWDLKDDGGRVVVLSDPKPSQDILHGDWTWVDAHSAPKSP